jgi:DNA-binding NarL/FixJ family response regulator
VPHAALTGLRVLVVEDEFLIALDLGSILDRLGCTVLGPAATVHEALHLLAADPPDVALLDLNLFDGRSTPVAEALVARGVPFAVVSAYAAAPEPVFDGVETVAKPHTAGRIRHAPLRLAGP